MHMTMLMHMPSKNVYVSDADLPLFETATALAGSLSAAVAAGLRLYLAQHKNRRKGNDMRTIELDVDEERVVTTKRFSGRQLLRWRRDEGMRTRSFRVFETAKGQLAVYERDDPNWAAISNPDDDNPVWEDPKTWRGDWWRRGNRELRVFPSVDDMVGQLPDELVDAVRRAGEVPAVEELDI